MKAKVIETGEIVEVKEWRGASDVIYSTPDMNRFFQKSELEFLPGPSEKVIEGWLCKNEYEDGFARIHTEEPQSGLDEMPITGEQLGIWRSNGNIFLISDELFPDLKWTDSPKKVKITITPME